MYHNVNSWSNTATERNECVCSYQYENCSETKQSQFVYIIIVCTTFNAFASGTFKNSVSKILNGLDDRFCSYLILTVFSSSNQSISLAEFNFFLRFPFFCALGTLPLVFTNQWIWGYWWDTLLNNSTERFPDQFSPHQMHILLTANSLPLYSFFAFIGNPVYNFFYII